MKSSQNFLSVYEKIYSTESIRENKEERIKFKSEYLESITKVVSEVETQSGLVSDMRKKISEIALFNINSPKIKKSPLLNFLINLLEKELQ